MTPTVQIAHALSYQHPEIYRAIVSALKSAEIKCETVMTGRNVWLRDYAPIETLLGPIRFRYDMSTRKKWQSLKLDDTYLWQWNSSRLPIALDGGNVVQNQTHVLMTNEVFKHNQNLNGGMLSTILWSLFGKQLVLIPSEPGDSLGHADGIVCFAGDGKTALVNDYSTLKSKTMDRYQEDLWSILNQSGLQTQPFPYANHRSPVMQEDEFRKKYPNADDFNSAVGYYINMLHVGKLVLLPVFGFPEDELAIEAAKKQFPGCTVTPIECFDLAMTGGCLRCITHEV